MKLFEGKSPEERNKLIAAMVLGVLALVALTYTFGGMFFGGKKPTVTVSASPTPTATASPRPNSDVAAMPDNAEINSIYTSTPVDYNNRDFYAPDAGRNIFAFYEPPVPTPYVPTPTPVPPPVIIPTPTPTPVPPFLVGFVSPQSVYAGSKTFRLEVNGDKFTPDSLILLNGSPLPTTFISPQKLVADVPSNFIAGVGEIMIRVQTPDGGLYSNQVSLKIEAPPTPQFQYIGLIARQRYNNDTAYFQATGKPSDPPVGKRLNDVLGGRFRLISISSEETIFEDVNLGFKHRLALLRPQPGQTAGVNPTPNQNPTLNNPGRIQQQTGKGSFNNPNNQITPQTNIPPGEYPPQGIPMNIPIYTPPQPPNSAPPTKTSPTNDDDDDGDN